MASDNEALYILVAQKNRQETTYSIIKIYNFTSFIKGEQGSSVENRIDFNREIIVPNKENFHFAIVTTQEIPERKYITLSYGDKLYMTRYKSKKGYIIKLTCVEKATHNIILADRPTEKTGIYYIAENLIYHIGIKDSKEIKQIILDISFLKEKITALGFFYLLGI